MTKTLLLYRRLLAAARRPLFRPIGAACAGDGHPPRRGSRWVLGLLTASLVGVTSLPLATAAWAGGSAVVQTNDGNGKTNRINVDFDTSRLRVDSSAQPDGYLIVRDGIAYMATSLGGAPMVIELTAMMRTFGARVQKLADGTDGVRQFESLTDTGRKETVAGVPGSVFDLIYVDGNGDRRRAEMVLSKEPHIAEFTREFRGLLSLFQRTANVEAPAGNVKLWQVIDQQKYGVLRYADRYQVVKLDPKAPPDARFTLPSAPAALPDVGNALRGILGGK